MKTLEERIKRGREAINKAKLEGKDTTMWEGHLADLEIQLADQGKDKDRVKVKMGAYGFCTCLLEKALCTGCWRLISACTCTEIEINQEEEITQQYALFLKKINTPLKH